MLLTAVFITVFIVAWWLGLMQGSQEARSMLKQRDKRLRDCQEQAREAQERAAELERRFNRERCRQCPLRPWSDD